MIRKLREGKFENKREQLMTFGEAFNEYLEDYASGIGEQFGQIGRIRFDPVV